MGSMWVMHFCLNDAMRFLSCMYGTYGILYSLQHLKQHVVDVVFITTAVMSSYFRLGLRVDTTDEPNE